MIEPIFSAIPANTMCTDIDRCRTLIQIVRSSVTALLAATYLSVHVNILRPNLPWYWKALDRAKIFLVALIFPDWIFMWAVRSFIVARRARTILEDARKLAQDAWANTDNPPPACKFWSTLASIIFNEERRQGKTGGACSFHMRQAGI